MKRLMIVLIGISYALSVQDNPMVLGTLPDEVSETSGIVVHKGRLITHNDSENDPILYELDTLNFEVERRILVQGVENVDWEDIAKDDRYLYIGDIGNNRSMRTDLAVYRVALADYERSETVSAERIAFSYEDQTDFSDAGARSRDWDAEALFVLDDALIILTKQWRSQGTAAYAIPKTPGEHVAERIGTYPIDGLVTGATLNPLSRTLYIVGYSELLRPFIAQIPDVLDQSFLAQDVNRMELDIQAAQIEGIAEIAVDRYFLTSERLRSSNPLITLESEVFSYLTSDRAWEGEGEPPVDEPEVPPQEGEAPARERLVLYRPPNSDFLHYDLHPERTVMGQSVFDVMGRRVYHREGTDIEGNTLDISPLRGSVFYLSLDLGNERLAKPFTKN